jgi:hypothetical protein
MARVPEDDMDERGSMEASENRGLPRGSGGGAGLHRVDPARLTQTLRSPEHAGGYARLELMLNSVMPRLVGEQRIPKEG